MENLTVLITGASGGIGYEFAKIFAKKNNNLILVSRNKGKLEQVRKELGDNIDILIIEKDLTLPNAAEEVYKEIKSNKMNVNVLINNAGSGVLGEFNDLSRQVQLKMLQLNIVTLTDLTYLCIQDMIEHKYGRILNVGSISSFLSTPIMSVYGASKSYVLSFSEALNSELKGKGDISVTALCPGPTKTNFIRISNMDNLGSIINIIATSPNKVAQIGYKSLENKKQIVIPGMRYSITILFARFVPRKLLQRLIATVLSRDTSKSR